MNLLFPPPATRARVAAPVDSLYMLGHFGEPGSESARRLAHLYVRLKTINAYPDFIRMASDMTRIYEGTGDTFRELNKRYSDAVVFCAVRAKRVRMGLGRVCIHYDVTGDAGVEFIDTPLVGLRVYIPGLGFRLPSLLPDVRLDDLRDVELPMPILEVEYLRRRQSPPWLGTADNLTFGHWKGYGPVPVTIRDHFPE